MANKVGLRKHWCQSGLDRKANRKTPEGEKPSRAYSNYEFIKGDDGRNAEAIRLHGNPTKASGMRWSFNKQILPSQAIISLVVRGYYLYICIFFCFVLKGGPRALTL